MAVQRILYVTGLPRAGSTLLCQLLGQHPDIYSIGHGSRSPTPWSNCAAN
ncbi:MAG: sulfotransferase [Gammaproteobacteria bacterium]